MEIVNEKLTLDTIAYMIGIIFTVIATIYFLLKYLNNIKEKSTLSFQSAKDVLKFVPIESIFLVVLKYYNKETTMGLTHKETEYILVERRKVQVTFDFSSIIENRNAFKRILKLSKLPDPTIEILKEPVSYEDHATKNIKNILRINYKKEKLPTDIILKVKRKAVSMIFESAENSGLKNIAKKRLYSQISMLQNALDKQGWNLIIENT